MRPRSRYQGRWSAVQRAPRCWINCSTRRTKQSYPTRALSLTPAIADLAEPTTRVTALAIRLSKGYITSGQNPFSFAFDSRSMTSVLQYPAPIEKSSRSKQSATIFFLHGALQPTRTCTSTTTSRLSAGNRAGLGDCGDSFHMSSSFIPQHQFRQSPSTMARV